MFFDTSVFRDRSRLNTTGESSAQGFRVYIQHRRLYVEAKGRSRGFQKKPMSLPMSLAMRAGFIGAATLWACLLFFVFGGLGTSPLVRLLSFCLGMAGAGTLGSLVARSIFQRTVWQWHACEHKAILMLRRDLEPTMENLRRVRASTPCCGSVGFFLVIAFAMAISLIEAFPIAAGFAVLSIMAAVWCLMFLVARGRRFWDILSRLMFVIGLPAIVAASALEWLLVLREPTPKQLERTLQFLWLMYRRHRWLASPKLRRSPVFQQFIARRPHTTAHS